MDPACPSLAHLAKGAGFEVALHTAGIYPDRLGSMLESLDWVGLDIKTTPDRYDSLTQTKTEFSACTEVAGSSFAVGQTL